MQVLAGPDGDCHSVLRPLGLHCGFLPICRTRATAANRTVRGRGEEAARLAAEEGRDRPGLCYVEHLLACNAHFSKWHAGYTALHATLHQASADIMGKLVIFISGVLLGAVGAFGTVVYLETRKPAQDDQLVFAPKNFYDSKQGGVDGYVGISGTLTGKGLGYPNNTYAVSCIGEYKACFVAYVRQIGHDHIGRMENPAAYPIVKWTEYEVVAQEEASLFGCYRVTMTIDRKMRALLWVEEPINQTKPNCKDADTTIRKYSIEDSPGWKKLHGNR
jgi:hypothetical protein